MKRRVLVDGVEVKVGVSLKVIVEGFHPDCEGAELHITLTDDGCTREVVMEGEVYESQVERYRSISAVPCCARCTRLIKKLWGCRRGIICPECDNWFCDECFDCEKGKGCVCHREE